MSDLDNIERRCLLAVLEGGETWQKFMADAEERMGLPWAAIKAARVQDEALKRGAPPRRPYEAPTAYRVRLQKTAEARRQVVRCSAHHILEECKFILPNPIVANTKEDSRYRYTASEQVLQDAFAPEKWPERCTEIPRQNLPMHPNRVYLQCEPS